MLLEPKVSDIGVFSYLKTIFFGKGFRIHHILDEEKNKKIDRHDYETPIPELLDSSEKGLLCISKRFIILTYLESDGKRRPVFVKRCKLMPNKNKIFEKAMHYNSDSEDFNYIDEDGWSWHLILNIASSRRRTFGTGVVFIKNKEGKELYYLQLI